MPATNAFVNPRFWIWLFAAILLMATSTIFIRKSSVRPYLFLITQLLILWQGIGIPWLALCLSVGFWSLGYLVLKSSGWKGTVFALSCILITILLFRRPLFIDLPARIARFQFVSALLPVLLIGFSYLTLRFLSFAIDWRYGKIRHPSLVLLLNYMLFAPSFVAGPIDRYPRFAAEFDRKPFMALQELTPALLRILSGLGKVILVKLLTPWSIASISPETLPVATAASLWRGLYIYSILLYVDFSGYSDLAIGTGKFFGISLPENFRWPYLQKNISDFWNHWHMSLSYWLRDYLFLPIGQRLFRWTIFQGRPLSVGAVAFLVTMGFCGLWHGTTLGFLVWGLLHGAALAVHKAVRSVVQTRASAGFRTAWNSKPANALATFATFNFVTAGWLFFALDWPQIPVVVRRMTGG
jgi:alginate O-acetyltransferase complex protein AlgI